jgi:hypothetical protein
VAEKIATAQVPFIKNEGLIADPDVRFFAKMFAGTLFVTKKNELVYSLPFSTGKETGASWAFRESFAGQKGTSPKGGPESSVRVGWFKGCHPDAWKRQLPTYSTVELGELYPGIRVSLKAAGNNIEKIFLVSPGADPEDIKIDVHGVQSLSLDARKQLVLETRLGNILFSAPVAYQMVDGKQRSVQVAYALADGQYRFKLGEYDKSKQLIIDPLLTSTLLGGHNPSPPGNYDDDIIHSMVIADDSIYVAGVTQSPDFPIVLGYDETLPNAWPDGFITRMSSDLSTVIASTYIGTESFDRVLDIAMDDSGEIVATGQAGYGFPVTDGAYNWRGMEPTGGGFIARLSADLSNLVASAMVTPDNYPRDLTIGNGSIYFQGSTNNPDLPVTPGAYDPTCGTDGNCNPGGFGIPQTFGFAGKLSADLSTLEALTYLDDGRSPNGMAVAPDGTLFISDGGDNAITGYLARFDADLTTRLAFLSYYPGSQSGSSRTYFKDVAAGDGYVVAAGQTYMYDLPATEGAYDTTCGTDGVCDGIGYLLVPRPDGFIAKYSYDLQDTLALTFLGGSDNESIRTLDVAEDGTVFVAGETLSTDFPTTGNAADSTCGTDGHCNPSGSHSNPETDGFVARLSPDLSTLEYASYLGGSGEDQPLVIALGTEGQAYVAGYTASADFPTTDGAFDETYNGGTSDAFISELDMEIDDTPPPENEPPVAEAGEDQIVRQRRWFILDGRQSNDPDGSIVTYRWRQISGQAVRIYNASGKVGFVRAPRLRGELYTALAFELEVTDDQGASAADAVRIMVIQ